MNKGRLFWGSFLLGLGAFVLLDRSGTLVFEWGGIWAFWPVLLILIGVSVLGGSGVLGRVAHDSRGRSRLYGSCLHRPGHR